MGMHGPAVVAAALSALPLPIVAAAPARAAPTPAVTTTQARAPPVTREAYPRRSCSACATARAVNALVAMGTAITP